jgi:hypothetical protein
MRIARLAWIAIPRVYRSACGGSATNDASRDPMALIQNACANIAGLNCPNGSELQDERADAVEDVCGSASAAEASRAFW